MKPLKDDIRRDDIRRRSLPDRTSRSQFPDRENAEEVQQWLAGKLAALSGDPTINGSSLEVQTINVGEPIPEDYSTLRCPSKSPFNYPAKAISKLQIALQHWPQGRFDVKVKVAETGTITIAYKLLESNEEA